MNNMLSTVVPKSDQINYDDMIGGQTKTIKITSVTIKPGDQPVSIHYEGDQGKPYKPGKSMSRVLVHCWGPDANKYVGRSLTLFGDPTVIFGGAKVGGLRISHLSDITASVTMALTSTRANRKPYTVQPLVIAAKPTYEAMLADIKAAQDLDDLESTYKEAYRLFPEEKQRAELIAAKNTRKTQLTPKGDTANV